MTVLDTAFLQDVIPTQILLCVRGIIRPTCTKKSGLAALHTKTRSGTVG